MPTVDRGVLCGGLMIVLACGIGASMFFSDSTVYSPGYTEAKFRSIRVGMSKADVIKTLGEPLSRDPAPGYVFWIYAAKDYRNPRPAGNGPAVIPAETAFKADVTGRIVFVSGGYLESKEHDFLGRSLDEVKAQLGEPLEVYAAPDRELYCYSKMQGIKGHYTRIIDISNEGAVSQITAGCIGHYVGDIDKHTLCWLEWLEIHLP